MDRTQYAIIIRRNVYAGTCSMDGHAHALTRYEVDGSQDDSGAPALWPTVEAARVYIAEQEDGPYTTLHGEAGRPEYWVVPESAVAEVQANAEDQGRYEWPADCGCWECADAYGNVCGECDQCRELMAAQDDAVLTAARVA